MQGSDRRHSASGCQRAPHSDVGHRDCTLDWPVCCMPCLYMLHYGFFVFNASWFHLHHLNYHSIEIAVVPTLPLLRVRQLFSSDSENGPLTLVCQGFASFDVHADVDAVLLTFQLFLFRVDYCYCLNFIIAFVLAACLITNICSPGITCT